MTDPDWAEAAQADNMFNFGQLHPEPVPEMRPNHNATASTVDSPEVKRNPLRDAISGRGKRNAEARNVKTPSPRKVVPNKPGQFITPVTDFYTTVAMVMLPFNPAVSMTIMGPAHVPTEEVPEPLTVAENCAKAWDEAAQRSERVRNLLDSFLTVGVLGTLIAAHMPIIMAAVPAKFNPAAAMEEMLRKQAEQQEN